MLIDFSSVKEVTVLDMNGGKVIVDINFVVSGCEQSYLRWGYRKFIS